jgi:hypothetical protein
MEVLMEVEGLSAVDLSDLSELVSLDEDVDDFFLRPRDGRGPDSVELETMLNSMVIKRPSSCSASHAVSRSVPSA